MENTKTKKLTLKEIEKVNRELAKQEEVEHAGYTVKVDKTFTRSKIVKANSEYDTLISKILGVDQDVMKNKKISQHDIDYISEHLTSFYYLIIMRHFTDIEIPDIATLDFNKTVNLYYQLLNIDNGGLIGAIWNKGFDKDELDKLHAAFGKFVQDKAEAKLLYDKVFTSIVNT